MHTRLLGALFILYAQLLCADHCWAWGDEGHATIALIAEHYLTPATRQRVSAILAADRDPLTEHNIAAASTWADKYRDSDRNSDRNPDRTADRNDPNTRYAKTYRWHFINLELHAPDFDYACYHQRGQRQQRLSQPASQGSAKSCVLDKIEQFHAEWQAPNTSADERLIALKYLLHLVGDLHQPLHVGDNHDNGGNLIAISSADSKPGNLHQFWDTRLVQNIDPNAEVLARHLIERASPAQQRLWASGTPLDWTNETYQIAKQQVYARLPTPRGDGSYWLTRDYIANGEVVVSTQLLKAGIRLAQLLEPPSQ